MDPVKILKRAWKILWQYRALWVFGLILALTAAGSTSGSPNTGSKYSVNDISQRYELPALEQIRTDLNATGKLIERTFKRGFPTSEPAQKELTAIIWIASFFVLFMLVTGIVMGIGRYVSETAVIRMVDEYEATDTKMTVRQGLRVGWSRSSWRLFLINWIVYIPIFVLLVALGVAAFNIYMLVSASKETYAIASIVGMIGITFLLIFTMVLLTIFLRLLRQFFWRVCVLENAGVRESLRRGFTMALENWKNAGLMWLIMMGLGITWMLLSVIGLVLLIPVVLITGVIGAFIAAIPGMLLVGLFSLFLQGALPWIIGGIFVLPLFAVIAFSPWILLSAWQTVYTSTVWTLTYREIKARPSPATEAEIDEVSA